MNTPPFVPPPDSGDKDTFESSLHRLEEIVAELERGDLALESSLAKYEEGVARLKKCYSILENIEKKDCVDHEKRRWDDSRNPI